MSETPIADSVRLALPAEAPQIAAIQRRAWQQLLPPTLSAIALEQVEVDDMTGAWHRAILAPPESRFRVMVALQDRKLVAFASTTPSEDPDAHPEADGQIDEFMVDPSAQRRGHGSRLMNACIDTLRADGFSRVTHWVSSSDDIRRRFFVAAGWATDGGHRELGIDDQPQAASDLTHPGTAQPETGQQTLKQVRLHTDVTPT